MKNLFFILIFSFIPVLGFTQDSLQARVPSPQFQEALIISYQISLLNQNLSNKYEKQMEHIRQIGYRIAGQTNDGRPFMFQFFKDPSVNAFALPGGFIFITEGMIKLDLSDDEWAHLLGHELTHIIHNHHEKAQQKQGFLKSFGIVLASLAVVVLASNELNKNKDNLYTRDAQEQRIQQYQNLYTVAFYGPLIANYLYSLKYSRELEQEADLYGRKFAAAAGYNPKGAESLFNKLSKSDSHQIDHIWRSHPEMLDRAFIATLQDEKVIEKDFTSETKESKEHSQTVLLQYALYFSNQKKGILKKDPKNDYDISMHNTLSLLHLTEIIIDIDKHSSVAPRILQLTYEQLIVLQLLNQSLPAWGRFYKLYKEVDPNNKNCVFLEKQSNQQYAELTDALNGNRAGIPVCRSLIYNFPEHPDAFNIRFGLVKSLFLNRSYKEVPINFLTACEYAKSDAEKKELANFGIRFISVCKNPYQLYCMADTLGDSDFSKEAKKKYLTMIDDCESLKEIVKILEEKSLEDLFADKVQIKEKALKNTFAKAKLKEKQKLKSEAYTYYNEIILYGEGSPFYALAEAALKSLAFE